MYVLVGKEVRFLVEGKVFINEVTSTKPSYGYGEYEVTVRHKKTLRNQLGGGNWVVEIQGWSIDLGFLSM